MSGKITKMLFIVHQNAKVLYAKYAKKTVSLHERTSTSKETLISQVFDLSYLYIEHSLTS